MSYTYPLGLIPMTAGWVKNNPSDNTVMGVSNDNHAGVKVVKTHAEMLAIHPNYLLKDYTACFVLDNDGQGTPAFYYLSAVPSNTDSTLDADWTEWEGADGSQIPGGLRFIGLLDPSSYTVRDDDAGLVAGDFYVVDTTNPVTINDPNFLGGVVTEVYNNDWLIFDAGLGYFVHIDRTFELIYTWAQITGKPTVITDLEAGIVPAHDQDANTIDINVTIDSTTYTKLDQLFSLILYTNKIATDLNSAGADQLLPYSLLQDAFVDENTVDTKIADALSSAFTNYYTKTEVDNLITESTDAAFDWDRPVKKEIKIGDILGGTTVTEGLEKLFDHVVPELSVEKDNKIRRGFDTNVSLTFSFTYNEATQIDTVTVYNTSDDQQRGTVAVGVGDPTAIVTINALNLSEGATEDWYAVINYQAGGNPHTLRVEEILVSEFVPLYAGGSDTSGDITDFDVNLSEVHVDAENVQLSESNKYIYLVVPVSSASEFVNGILDENGNRLDGGGFSKVTELAVAFTTPNVPFNEDVFIYQSSYKTSYTDKIYPR